MNYKIKYLYEAVLIRKCDIEVYVDWQYIFTLYPSNDKRQYEEIIMNKENTDETYV